MLKFRPEVYDFSRVEAFEHYLKMATHFMKKLGRPPTEQEANFIILNFKDQLPFGIHYKLFVPTLRNLCN